MIIATTVGLVEVWAKTTSSLDRVILATGSSEMIESIIASIELAGASEDTGDIGKWDEYQYDGKTGWYTLELDRTTFKIWFEFEVDGFMKYGKGELEKDADEFHQRRIEEIRRMM